MASVPYILKPSAIPEFLNHIQEAGIPSKVTTQYLESVGFTSKNERALISIFKTLGFIDQSGAPTEVWRAYRNKSEGPKILGRAIQETYPGLFSTYPDAHRKDDEALTNWVRSNTNYSDDVVRRAVTTFKTLCSKASFDFDVSQVDYPSKGEDNVNIATPREVGRIDGAPTININIQLQLPPSEDPETYENFFSAMKRHLFDDA